MSGSVVTVRINGQPFQLGCDKGQEAEIEALGKMVDDTVKSLSGSIGQIGEMRLLVMAAILLAEQAKAKAPTAEPAAEPAPESAPESAGEPAGDIVTDQQIAKLENITAQISTLAASLKSA